MPMINFSTPEDLTEAICESAAVNRGHLWFRHEQTAIDGNWEDFLACFAQVEDDILAVHLRDPDGEGDAAPADDGAPPAISLSLLRLSPPACRAIRAAIEVGWKHPIETMIIVAAKTAGLTCSEVGGCGPLTPAERAGKFYDESSIVADGVPRFAAGMIHYPLPATFQPLSPRRLDCSWLAGADPDRILFVAPVCEKRLYLVERSLVAFQAAGADCLLLNYGEEAIYPPEGVEVINDRDSKFLLAVKHLTPERVDGYDYIFFWDDDLDPLEFEPRRFVNLMRMNGLQMAQPGIVPLYPLAHPITCWNENLPAGINRASRLSERIVGRMTNFVEIMAPAFTREAWLELYQYMSPLNASGWGYDYIPLGRRGIIDIMPVVHTRRVQSLNEEAMADIQDFLISNGLIACQPADCGWVLEPLLTPSSPVGGAESESGIREE